MENTEVEILLIEDNLQDAETAIRILQTNNLSDKLIHLKNGAEANDFIFCTGTFEGRNINNQPKTILFNMNMMKRSDMEFLNKIASDERTKEITLVVLTSKMEENKINTQVQEKPNGAMLSSMFDLIVI